MTSDQSDSNKPKTIEALVPMVDLFAMLAIMFMIYSNDEIIYAKQESQAEIQKLTEQVEEIAEEEQAREDRRKQLAQQSGMSLEQLKAEQAQQAQQLIEQFTKMVAAQQNQAAADYENLVAKIELEHDRALEEEVTSLEEQSQADLAKKKEELETELTNKQLELEKEKQEELVVAKLQFENELSSKVSELTSEKEQALQELKRELEEKISSAETALEDTRKALAESDEQQQALAAQKELELANQKKELEKVEQALKEQAASQAAKLEAEKERALVEAEAKAEQERQRLEAEKKRALAKAEQERQKLAAEKERALAKAEQERNKLAAEKERALAKAEQERNKLAAEKERALAEAKAKAEKERKKLEAEKARALAKADEAEKLASETEQYLSRVVDELNPYLKAEDAKQKIVEQLKENFKDFGPEAVEIDEKTGKVKLHFQQTYFARGSYELSEDMKSFLRIMIPKYAKSIYENKQAAKHIDSLKISGMTSPVYQGKYIAINDKSPQTEKARRYNMKLSNKRALAMYNFIFDEKEMKNFKYRDRLKADMGIAALGFQNAAPVKKKLVGKTADCKEYDCKHEQATVLQFHLYTED